MNPMYVTGIDENGLGPRLGPMTTTSVTIALRGRYDVKRLATRGVACGITDSKATSSSRKMAFAEGVSLALIEAASGTIPATASELLGRLHLDGPASLESPCPDPATRALCHGRDSLLPMFGGSVEEGRDALAPLVRGRAPLRIVSVNTVVHCAAVLNREHAAGRNKLVLDLEAMETLTLAAARTVGVHTIVAGMIGGIRDVPKFASRIPREAFVPRVEERGIRAYDLDGVGRISFEVDADEKHLPVALASIVGKYVRELGMQRIVAFHRAEDPSLGTPSGYHDPVTARFVEASAPIRRRLAIAEGCFERIG